jgi:hypothetical protein
MVQVVAPALSSTLVSDHATSASGFSDSVSRLLDKTDVRLADSGEEREAIARLRYQAYLREGAISSNAGEKFTDPDDDSDNAYLFGIYVDGELASSLRMHVANSEHPDCPSLHVFPVLQHYLEAGQVLIDSTRFAADENLSRLHRGLPYVTVRLGWMAAEYFNADHLLAAVRAEHQAFYRRTFRHRLICEPRPYPQLEKPICLMTTSYRAVADDVHRRYPFFRSTLFERRMLFERASGAADRRPVVAEGVAPLMERDIRRLAG